jgi:hypothetical protein
MASVRTHLHVYECFEPAASVGHTAGVKRKGGPSLAISSPNPESMHGDQNQKVTAMTLRYPQPCSAPWLRHEALATAFTVVLLVIGAGSALRFW